MKKALKKTLKVTGLIVLAIIVLIVTRDKDSASFVLIRL